MRFWRMFGWAPWWRGPLLLLRRPGVAFALAVAAAVAALPVAALPVFLSSAGAATLHSRTSTACEWLLGSHLEWQQWFDGRDTDPTSSGLAAVTRRAELERSLAAGIAGLGEATFTYYVEGDTIRFGSHDAKATLVARDGFADQVQVISGPSGKGVWLPQQLAKQLGAKVGDRVTVQSGDDVDLPVPTQDGSDEIQEDVLKPELVTVPVAAIYRDLRQVTPSAYWCSSSWLFEGKPNQGPNQPVFPMVLADSQTLVDIADRQVADVGVYLERPVTGLATLTVPEASRLSSDIERMHASLRSSFVPVGESDGPMPTPDQQDTDTSFVVQLVGFVQRSVLVQDSLATTVTPISLAGLLVGLAVVIAAGVFWVRRRRAELTVLAVHGVTAGRLGVKAMLEALPALVVGTAGGWLVAQILVDRFGPGGTITDEATRLSVELGIVSLIVVTALIGLTASLACRRLVGVEPHVERGFRPARWPWEVLLLAGAAPVWFFGGSEAVTAFRDGLGEVALLPLRLLLVPIMVLAGMAILAGRLVHRALRRAGARSMRQDRIIRHLIGRRLQHAASAAAVLAVITALPIGLAVFSSTVTGSVQATLAAEAEVFVGAEMVVTLSEQTPIPPSLQDRATPVTRVDGVVVNGTTYSVLLVDPQTFGRYAAWDDRINGQSLEQTASRLRPALPGATGHAIAMGSVTGTHEIELVGVGTSSYDVDDVNRLPAAHGGYPVLLLDRAVLDDVQPAAAVHQWWIRGDPAQVKALLAESGATVSRISVAQDLYRGTFFEPITYTFDYLAALSLLAGLVTTVGFLLYLESRLPTLRRGFTMLSRMGLRRGQHLAVLALEIGAPLVVGLSVGIAVTAAVVASLSPYFEINRDAAPSTVLQVPVLLLGGLVAGVAVTTSVAVGFAQSHVRRARAGEVLRDAS